MWRRCVCEHQDLNGGGTAQSEQRLLMPFIHFAEPLTVFFTSFSFLHFLFHHGLLILPQGGRPLERVEHFIYFSIFQVATALLAAGSTLTSLIPWHTPYWKRSALRNRMGLACKTIGKSGKATAIKLYVCGHRPHQFWELSRKIIILRMRNCAIAQC